MIKLKFYGLGGQGVVTAGKVFSKAVKSTFGEKAGDSNAKAARDAHEGIKKA